MSSPGDGTTAVYSTVHYNSKDQHSVQHIGEDRHTVHTELPGTLKLTLTVENPNEDCER